MHISKFGAFAAALALPLVQAQSISLANLPKCAQAPATSGLASTPCDLTNLACICSAVEFVTALTTKVQESCSAADQQATLSFAQGLCARFGVTLNVPAIAANVPSSAPAAAAPAQAASAAPAPSSAAAAPVSASGSPEEDMMDDAVPAGETTTPAASSAETMSSAPVSPNDAFPTSSSASLDEAPLENEEGAEDVVAATTGEASPSIPVSTSSILVYDTKSIIPSATIASYPASKSTSADASSLDAQVPTSTTAYRNSSSTANSTVAASSPIPYVGAAMKEKVQGGMVMMVALVVFWGL
ncbi:MAG: hypothetical protein Q9192_000406 [Flavoplaca navasiana]